MTLPHPSPLIIIGAQRSGTTYLYHVMNAHPSVRMAEPVWPEPKFFLDAEKLKGGREGYEKELFGELDEGLIPGEKSTSYIEFPTVAERIHTLFPDARLIALLRDPVERALSNYWFSRKQGLEPRSLKDVFIEGTPPPFLESEVSVDPFDYLGRGEYAMQLRPFWESFGNDRVHVLIHEEFTGREEALRELYRSLGLDEVPVPDLGKESLNQGERKEDPDEAEVRDFLREYYEEAIKALEKALGRNLDVWK
ncbi:MAG: sulfotransferase [Flavobacteriales bacterium]